MENKQEDCGVYQVQVGTNVSFSAFMTAVCMFFIGVLLTKFESFDITIKIPLSFLIISVFGFLYATLILANASEMVSQRKILEFRRYMKLGDILSEYLGIYLLVLSIPLVINVVSQDLYLRSITLVAALGGLAIYQFSHFSILERHLSETNRIITVLIIAFGLCLFFSQIYAFYFTTVSAIFIAFILTVTYFTTKYK